MNKLWLDAYPSDTPAEIDPDSVRSLVEMLAESCRCFADRPAFHNLGVTLTYLELDRLSRAFAAYLVSRGLHKGDRIALMLPNILQYPVALFGSLRAGLVVVNTNPLYTPRELLHQLKDSGARAIVVLENFAHVLAEVRDETVLEYVMVTAIGDLTPVYKRLPINFVARRIKHLVPAYELPEAIGFRDALDDGSQLTLPPVGITATDTALLQYTGGTTGVAKGAFLTHRVGSVGLPLPSTEISIRDGELELPPGEAGELCVRGPQVMAGYWNRPEETKSTFAEGGWLRTGDIAVLEKDGFLRIVDRKKDLIIVSGFKVFPNEIEAVVCEHPAVLDCGCAGIGDDRSPKPSRSSSWSVPESA